VIITVDDLRAYDPGIDQVKAEAMIEDATAQATLCAPCLADETTLTPTQVKQFRSVLRAAILRWDSQGASGVVQTTDTALSYTHQETVDNRQARKGLFWPSEIDLLKAICSGHVKRCATVDTTPPSSFHAHLAGM